MSIVCGCVKCFLTGTTAFATSGDCSSLLLEPYRLLFPHYSVRGLGSETCPAQESSAGRSLRRAALSSCHTSLSYSEPRESPFYGEPTLILRALFRGVPFTLPAYPSEGEPFLRGTLSHACGEPALRVSVNHTPFTPQDGHASFELLS